MSVYFIRAGAFIKIGITGDILLRLTKMQSDSAERLEVLGLMDGGRADEQALHEKFRAFHARGEWYADAPDIRAYISTYASAFADSRFSGSLIGQRYGHTPLGHYIASNKIEPSAFAASIGTDPGNLSRILSGKQHPSAKLYRRILTVTNGQVTPNDFFDLPVYCKNSEAA